MIAPCGLNCAVCSEALREDSPCVGCRNEGRKGEYCANLCKIVNCGIRKTGGREIEFFMNTRYNKDAALKRFRKKSVPMCKYINGRTRS